MIKKSEEGDFMMLFPELNAFQFEAWQRGSAESGGVVKEWVKKPRKHLEWRRFRIHKIKNTVPLTQRSLGRSCLSE